jgi:multidrug efflux pump subunit AcrA (membrane-fusion protein)
MQESPQRTENRVVDHPRVQDDMGFFDEEGSPVPTGTASPQQGRGRIGRIAAIVILLLVILLGGLAFALLRPNAAPRATYQNQTVVQGNLQLTVSATGPIQGTTYNADFLVTGKISEIDVSVGQHVNAGKTLAKLDTSTLPSNANQSDAVLTAPHGGTVTVINGAVGASSSVGNNSTHFIEIVDSSSLSILANVNEVDIAKAAVGNAVTFTVGGYSTQQFQGTVHAIAPQGQTASNVVTYPVTINVDMNSLQGANLLPGMTANVTITTQSRTNVLLIPVSAVNFAQSAQAQGLISQNQVATALTQAHQQLSTLQSTGVTSGTTSNPNPVTNDNPNPAFVLTSSNGQLVAVPVVLGLSNGSVYEVLSGLSEGQSIATSSSNGG